ncbi:MAG: hypothetical protein WBA39_20440 [Rivularia sp. (in: cyanobacteria)]
MADLAGIDGQARLVRYAMFQVDTAIRSTFPGIE